MYKFSFEYRTTVMSFKTVQNILPRLVVEVQILAIQYCHTGKCVHFVTMHIQHTSFQLNLSLLSAAS